MRRSFRILDRNGSQASRMRIFSKWPPDERAGNVSVLTNATLGKNGDTCRAYLIALLCRVAGLLSSVVPTSWNVQF